MTMCRLEMGVEGSGDVAGFLVYSREKSSAIEIMSGDWAGKPVRKYLPTGAGNLKEIYRNYGKANAFDVPWLGAVLFEELCKVYANGAISLFVDEISKNVNHILIDDDNPDFDLETQLKYLLNRSQLEFSIDGMPREINWS